MKLDNKGDDVGRVMRWFKIGCVVGVLGVVLNCRRQNPSFRWN